MPYEDDEVRRAARERLQARMERRGSADTLASNSSVNSARRTAGASEQQAQQPRFASAGGRQARSGSADGGQLRPDSGDGRQPRPVSSGGRQPQLYTPKQAKRHVELGPLSFDIPAQILPDSVPPLAVPIAVAVIVLLLVFAVIVPSCTRHASDASEGSQGTSVPSQSADSYAASSPTQDGTASPTANAVPAGQGNTGTVSQKIVNAKAEAEKRVQNAGQVESLDTQESHQAALTTLLGDEISAKLLAQAKTGKEALWIAAHPDAFAFDGVEVQYKVLKLAADEPKAIDYVRNFPKSYPADEPSTDKSLAMSTSSPASNVADTAIPHLYQWDRRWGYTTYSSAAFGLTGCGPTSLAMVYQGLTGKSDKTPYDMGKLADERGYMSEYEGTLGAFFTDTAEELGLYCEELYPDPDTLRNALEHGQTVIANLAPGYFTANGHYFVVTALTDDGEAIINDPYSVERSAQTWDLDLIASQSYILYGYSKAD